MAKAPVVEPLSQLAYTCEQVAALLGGITDDMVRDLIDRGELPCMRLGRRVLVTRYELEAWVKAHGRDALPGMGEQ